MLVLVLVLFFLRLYAVFLWSLEGVVQISSDYVTGKYKKGMKFILFRQNYFIQKNKLFQPVNKKLKVTNNLQLSSSYTIIHYSFACLSS